ncbi:ferritin-like domain-containing protein [Chromobacterium vaccinii]|uniref:ferritin-like domain-containing protein n=1 Tax=Chromobacterium vaccinii TaxID=1108595 RepID=UPI000E15EC40|nr:ferritin-like domain-containing protein [Chromobacterium vaccinii]SUX55816.1 Uncharacterized protein related to plant photosystem II stability/assembly factor [Chromobacterium vaccinii]
MSVSHRPLRQATAQQAGVRDIQSLPGAEFADRLPSLLQQALRREHSLTPPLLAAWLSLKPAANRALSILLEEAIASQMRRMALAANLQIAIGGQPRVALPGFAPAYPSSPPLAPEAPAMGIEPFSPRLLRDVLLPQIALSRDGENRHAGAAGFYLSLREGFQQCHKQLNFDARRSQALDYPPGPPIAAIRGLDDALAALNELASHHAPLCDGLAAFAASDSPPGFDPDSVWPMPANVRLDDYPPGSPEQALLARFSACYADFLSHLDAAFSGRVQAMAHALDLLFDLRLLAAGLMNPAIVIAPGHPQPLPPIGLCFAGAADPAGDPFHSGSHAPSG